MLTSQLRCSKSCWKFGTWDLKEAQKNSAAETVPLESSRLVIPKGKPNIFNTENNGQGSNEMVFPEVECTQLKGLLSVPPSCPAYSFWHLNVYSFTKLWWQSMVVGLSFIQSSQSKAYEPALVSFLRNFLSNYTVKSKTHGTTNLG